jgi:hypothetical protein
MSRDSCIEIHRGLLRLLVVEHDLAAPGGDLRRLRVRVHPFPGVIWDHETGTVLFIGRPIRPEGEIVGQAEALPSDAETVCSILDECVDRTPSLAECADSFASDSPAAVNRCADCYRAELDLAGDGIVDERAQTGRSPLIEKEARAVQHPSSFLKSRFSLDCTVLLPVVRLSTVPSQSSQIP